MKMPIPSPSEVVPFLPEQPFIRQNLEPVTEIFGRLAQDFPDRSVIVEEQSYATPEALQIDEAGELTPAAREWLWIYAQGRQHGYDRGVDGKIFIPPGASTAEYMGRLGNLNCGEVNLVAGGRSQTGTVDTNVLVIGGFPHLNGDRLRAALADDYTNLLAVNSIIMLVGQRRRWNDNPNESTADTVIARTAAATGFDLKNSAHQAQLDWLAEHSQFMRAEAAKPEAEGDWGQAYATEYEEGRLALELAILRAEATLDLPIFDWNSNPVTIREAEGEPIPFDGGVVPARTQSLTTYHLNNGVRLHAVNAPAIPRPRGAEARHTSESTIIETVSLLGHLLARHINIIATGAPHIRTAYDAAIGLLVATRGELAPVHLSAAPWESHEPPVTGIANIVSTDKADKRLRAAAAGSNPNAPELLAL